MYYTMTTTTPAPISVRIGTKERKALDQVAKSLDRDRSYVINEAVKNYLALYEWQIEHITEGVRQADRGEFASDAALKKLFAA